MSGEPLHDFKPMGRSAAVEHLTRRIAHFAGSYSRFWFNWHSDDIEAVLGLLQDEWISVEDRMPEVIERVSADVANDGPCTPPTLGG